MPTLQQRQYSERTSKTFLMDTKVTFSMLTKSPLPPFQNFKIPYWNEITFAEVP
jgi:hypothetical protein